jgi:hypothetical protein
MNSSALGKSHVVRYCDPCDAPRNYVAFWEQLITQAVIRFSQRAVLLRLYLLYIVSCLNRYKYMHVWLLTHGAEPLLRSRQLCSYSRIFQYFMEPEGSFPCSQEPSTGPCPDPDQSNPYHPI